MAAAAAAIPFIQAAGAAMTVVSALKGPPKSAPPPEVKKPKLAPATDNKAAERSNQMKMQRKYAGAGRSGTILSEGSSLG